MKQGPLQKKTLDYAVKMVELYRSLSEDKDEHIMSEELMRTGVMLGMFAKRSAHARSMDEFIELLASAQAEAMENQYWLTLLHKTGYIQEEEFQDLESQVESFFTMMENMMVSAHGREN